MNATATSMPPASRHSRREIATHFAGRISPTGESAMRAHLPTCASCRHRYDRHLILARLDPRALPAAQRIAGGLGLRFPSHDKRGGPWLRWVAGVTIPLAAAAVLVFWPGPGNRRSQVGSGDSDGTFATRGAPPSDAHASSFWTYRLTPGGTPRLADRTIAAGDELAFAYSNPAGKPYVMIFGVDEHRHVYWFHPAWPTGEPPPTAIRASAGPGPHELSDAIHHALDGRHLTVYAIFAERPLAATTVEARVRTAVGMESLSSIGDGVVVARRMFEVRP